MSYKDPDDRRKYQRNYYKSRKWKKRRAAASSRYQKRQLEAYRALCRQRFVLDNYTCVHCGKKFSPTDVFGFGSALTVDHLIPRPPGNQHGGSAATFRRRDTIDTIRTACRVCNARRKSKPMCRNCYTLTLPWRHSSGALCCTKCGKLNTFPPDTPVREVDVDAEPDWIHETETDDAET